MPGFDGTGPLGRGSLTGRGFGPCGRGMAFRRGAGRGFGRRFARSAYGPTRDEEKEALKAEKAAIDVRLKELEGE
jgi:hypothetical protein